MISLAVLTDVIAVIEVIEYRDSMVDSKYCNNKSVGLRNYVAGLVENCVCL